MLAKGLTASMCEWQNKGHFVSTDKLAPIFDIAFDHGAWISGSYVRDCIVRGEHFTDDRDIDLLMLFDDRQRFLDVLREKYDATIVNLFYDEEDTCAHDHVFITLTTEVESDKNKSPCAAITLDIFSCEDYCYLSAPDVDVNTLCLASPGELQSWMSFGFEDSLAYGHPMDIRDIKERCQRKEAIALTREWATYADDENKEAVYQRAKSLQDKGWSVLNQDQMQGFVSQ